jgi:hypothetical protein
MAALDPETGDVGVESVSVGADAPGSGSPLPVPAVGPVPVEEFGSAGGGRLDAPSDTPQRNPHNWPLLAEAAVVDKGDNVNDAPPPQPAEDEGDATRVEDDRFR